MSQQSSGWAGLAGDTVVRPGEHAEARRSSPRTKAGECGALGGVNGASEASRRCVVTCGRRPC